MLKKLYFVVLHANDQSTANSSTFFSDKLTQLSGFSMLITFSYRSKPGWFLQGLVRQQIVRLKNTKITKVTFDTYWHFDSEAYFVSSAAAEIVDCS